MARSKLSRLMRKKKKRHNNGMDMPGLLKKPRAATSVSSLPPKLTIASVNDPREKHADDVARRVMSNRTPVSIKDSGTLGHRRMASQHSSGQASRSPFVLRQAATRRDAAVTTPDISSRVFGLRGRGEPLSRADRSFFAPRMPEVDINKVRVHTDSGSQQLARQINARAFAFENNIVLGRGEHRPGTIEGRTLLAHELAHVAQADATANVQRAVLYKKDISDTIGDALFDRFRSPQKKFKIRYDRMFKIIHPQKKSSPRLYGRHLKENTDTLIEFMNTGLGYLRSSRGLSGKERRMIVSNLNFFRNRYNRIVANFNKFNKLYFAGIGGPFGNKDKGDVFLRKISEHRGRMSSDLNDVRVAFEIAGLPLK